MNHWTTKTIGEVCQFSNGLWRGEKPPFVNAGVIRNTNFTKDGTLDDSDIAYLDVEAKKFEKRRLKSGDIILEKSGGGPKQPVGRVVLFDKTEGNFSFSNFTAVLRILDSQKLDSRFLHKFLHWTYLSGITERMQSNSTGIRNLDSDAYKSIQISFPSLAEQERIVKLLDEADELRKLRTQANRRADALIPALFHEMFGDPEVNSKGWPRGLLKDFGAQVRYGLGQPPEEDLKGVPILRATNVKRGSISEVGLIRVKREAVPTSRNAFLNADDVLVVRSGAYTGDIAKVGEKWAGAVAGYDLVVSPKERFAGDFIAWFFLSDFVQDRYFKGLKLRAAQPHLNSTQVAETPFFCPPLALQKEFARRVTEIRELEAEQVTSRTRLDALFQSMLHRAFNREL
jgi:type I restriction enzyme S subunit